MVVIWIGVAFAVYGVAVSVDHGVVVVVDYAVVVGFVVVHGAAHDVMLRVALVPSVIQTKVTATTR